MTTAARLKLSALLEIYTPTNAGRTAALEALRQGVTEFEAEVRADERALVLAEQPQMPLAPSPSAADERRDVAGEAARIVEQSPGLKDDGAHLPEPLGNDADAPADVTPPSGGRRNRR